MFGEKNRRRWSIIFCVSPVHRLLQFYDSQNGFAFNRLDDPFTFHVEAYSLRELQREIRRRRRRRWPFRQLVRSRCPRRRAKLLPAELKAAFRAKVKQYHPDVNREGDSDAMIRLVIQAYEMLSNYSRSDIIESECLDPFDEPECEALDLFVNELLCVGKGCPYSCVKAAPHAFTFATSGGTARATSRGNGDDYQVQVAVGQCPRNCIHYVTPSQRIILEELLDSIMDVPYDTSAEADLLYSLIVKAKFENNRFRKPKKQPKSSTDHVDWY